jgi:outer membrane receptor for ferric coprogen and ferric-rhodotorulic acid
MVQDEAQRKVLHFFALSNSEQPGAFVIADAAADIGNGLDDATVYAAVEALRATGLLECDPPQGAVSGLTRVRITAKGASVAGPVDGAAS